ncbi:MAG: heat-shock protein Hsp90, partial [Selenomonas sp.]
EKKLSEKLIAALKEDVSSIDASLAFFRSDEAKSIFGAEEAANLAKKAEEFKAAGNKICFCPACQAGEAVLENASVLLK